MPDFLALMAQGSERRAARAKTVTGVATLRGRVGDLPPAAPFRSHAERFDLIAEVKRHSPAQGVLQTDVADDGDFAARQARAYARGGAAAISVLTEPERFRGSLEDLAGAARAVEIPVMRKDFLVDPYQVIEARAFGAGGVLLILRLLDDARLTEMIDAAAELGMFVLLEAFGEDDLARAGQLGVAAKGVQLLVGLNARNLATLQVDGERLARLAGAFPTKMPRVAESGLESPEDVARTAALEYDVALVGSALMKASNPSKLAAAMISAGRAEAVKQCASA